MSGGDGQATDIGSGVMLRMTSTGLTIWAGDVRQHLSLGEIVTMLKHAPAFTDALTRAIRNRL